MGPQCNFSSDGGRSTWDFSFALTKPPASSRNELVTTDVRTKHILHQPVEAKRDKSMYGSLGNHVEEIKLFSYNIHKHLIIST